MVLAALAVQAVRAVPAVPAVRAVQAVLRLQAVEVLQAEEVLSLVLAGGAAALPELLRESHPFARECTDSAREV